MENKKNEAIHFLKKKYIAITGHQAPNFKTPEEYLQAICEYYENIIAILPNNVYWLDRNCILRGCNNNVAKLCNLPREKCIGLDYEQIRKSSGLTSAQIESFKRDDVEVISTGKPKFNVEEPPLLDSEGNPVNCYISTRVPIMDKSGKVVGVIGISTDIIDHKRAEEYRLKHEATKKVLDLSNLIAGSIAHELRLPLGGIRVSMEALMGTDFSKIPPQKGKEFLNKMAGDVIKVVDATTHVVSDMLIKVRSFATGEIKHGDFETISITADIESLLETYPFENNEQELVSVSYGARFKYTGDKVLTAHLLGNLLRNALHAIKETDKTDARVSIETKTEGDSNLLIFRDTATGVTKDFLSKMFDTFETKKTTHGGTGLGLAFCKMVMEDCYGGSITCNSEEGKYTEFVLSFPKLK